MNNEQKKQIAFEVVKNTPYLKLLGIELDEIDVGIAVMSLPMTEKLRQPHGLLHGGADARRAMAGTRPPSRQPLPFDQPSGCS